MTAPGDGQVPAQIVTMILDGLREVKESVSRLGLDVTGQMSRLPDLYVPRREVEHRLDEHTIDIGEVRSTIVQKVARHDADVHAIREVIDAMEQRRLDVRKEDEERRETYRRWAIGLTVPTVLTLIGLVIAVLSLMARTT